MNKKILLKQSIANAKNTFNKDYIGKYYLHKLRIRITETQCFGFHSSTKRTGCVEQSPQEEWQTALAN